MIDLFSKVENYAKENYDGHFTLMKFTTNWRACYGTVENRHTIDYMVKGATVEETLMNLLNNPIDVYQINHLVIIDTLEN